MNYVRLVFLGLVSFLVFGGCNGLPDQTSPREPLGETEDAVATPCTQDLQGYGAIGAGWFGLRTDGTVWHSEMNLGEAAERFDALGNDNASLADMDGEALGNCALKTNGDIYCWGLNESGQLGGGFTSPEEDDPVQVEGLPSAAAQVGVSVDFACARLTDGTVWCWGNNHYGQLGIGSTSDTPSLVPVQVTTLGSVDSISVGYDHACALKAGAVWCWGDNEKGSVGSGSFASMTIPTPVQAQTGVTLLSAGGFYTCTVKTDHTLWCWGDNFFGQLGLNDYTNRAGPNQVTALGANVSYVDTAVHSTCAVLTSGAVRCWGSQGDGRLGNGVNDGNFCQTSGVGPCVPTPIPVSGALGSTGGVDHLRETEGAVCAVMTNGHLFCWGGGGFLDGHGLSTTPVEIDFCGLPTLDTISPAFDTYTGGDVITLTGTEFAAGATVTFDSTPGVGVTVVNDTTITVTTPNYGFNDTVDVIVTNPDGHRAKLLDAFDFTAPPSIGSLTPESGTSLGGDVVSVQGQNFSQNTAVDFGGATATNVTLVDVEHLTVTTPAHAAGTVDVTVTNPGGATAQLPMAFTFIAPLTVTSLDPNTGPTAGGGAIVFTGDGFDFTTTVAFDGVASAEVVATGSTSMSVALPAHAAGVVDVVVTRGDGQTFTLPAGFTYSNQPSAAAGGGATASGGAGGGSDGPADGGCYCDVGPGRTEGGALALVGVLVLGIRRKRSSRHVA